MKVNGSPWQLRLVKINSEHKGFIMKIATIDIGTNTILLLIADFEIEDIRTLVYEQRTPRIGKNIDADGIIGKPAFARVIDVFKEYKTIIKKFKPEKTVAFGTSALREASNKDEFVKFIKAETTLDVEILDGKDEAFWGYRGATSGIKCDKKMVVIDIGGGSTEISEGTSKEVDCVNSLNVGAVRISERFFRNNPPTSTEIQLASDFIKNTITKLPPCDFSEATLIGVAGTPTTLASIDQGILNFDVNRITGYKLTIENIEKIFHKFCKMRTEEIRALSETTEGRADIITAGTLILLEFMKIGGFTELIVSERGVRYGIGIRELEKSNN
jgi:exopolyphosphatase / guanosine-5'-triphosphate,3'-diphosphate pyrophosphatase